MTPGLHILIAVAALAAATTAAGAQSLGDVARKEAERRAAAGASKKVYTNTDLAPESVPPATSPPAAATAPESPAPAPVRAAREAGAAPKTSPADGVATSTQDGVTPRDEQEPQRPNDKGEDYWRGRATLIRARLANQQAQIKALQQQVSSFGDGSSRSERDIAVQALKKAQDDLVSLNDEWLRFERQARERNIPDAWIR